MSNLSNYTDDQLIEIVTSDTEAELRKRGYEFGWHKPITFIGAIYILVNSAFPDLVKLGYADDVEKRLKSLNSNSGLPDPFHCYAIYQVRKRLEDLKLHKLIDSLDSDLRHSPNREFYEMDCGKAFGILSAIAQINGNEEQLILNPFNDPYFGGVAPQAATSKGQIPDGEYYFERSVKVWGGRRVKGIIKVENGRYIVLKGAICNPFPCKDDVVKNIVKSVREKIKIENNILQEDVEFTTPSGAASFICYNSVNGWSDIKTKDGQPISKFKQL